MKSTPNDHIIKIAVDFDGTCVDRRFPDVGPDVPGAVETMRRINEFDNYVLILYTMRDSHYIKDAIAWFAERGIQLYGVQNDPDQISWTNSPKCYAHMVIDDTAFGCPLIHPLGFQNPCVDWTDVLSDIFKL